MLTRSSQQLNAVPHQTINIKSVPYMTVRDKYGTIDSFTQVIREYSEYIREDEADIEYIREKEKGGVQAYSLPNDEVIANTHLLDINYRLRIMLASYSMGVEIEELHKQYIVIAPLFAETWNRITTVVPILQMLSIGILINIDDVYFDKLVQVVEKDGRKDFSLGYLIHYRKPDWNISLNSYIQKSPYQHIQNIVTMAQSDKKEAVKCLKQYLTKYWYKGHSSEAWYNLHKKDINSYFGYWSFESGALVKVLGLDDSSLKGLQYYPYDMVHWNEK